MKNSKVFIVIILILTGSILFIVNGEASKYVSILAGTPNYLIVCPDDFYSNAKLAQYVQFKEAQGYSIELKKLSEIPIPVNTPPALLKVRNIEKINSTYYYENLVYTEGNQYKVMAFAYLNTMSDPTTKQLVKSGNFITQPTVTKEVCLYTGAYNRQGQITLTYDGGQTKTVYLDDYPAFFDMWGVQAITQDGHLFYFKTQADSIRDYIYSKVGIEYVLLLGNIHKVPSFSVKEVINSRDSNGMGYIYSFSQGYSDSLYAVRDPFSNKYLLPDTIVSRLPVENVAELELCLNKSINFKPHMSNKVSFFQGGDTDSTSYLYYFRDPINNTLQQLYENIATYDYRTVREDGTSISQQTAINAINFENDYIIVLSHGMTSNIGLCAGGLANSMISSNTINFKNSSMVWALSCSTSDFSYFSGQKCIGEAFITDVDSNCVAYVGASLVVGYSVKMATEMFEYIKTYKTVGKCFTEAKKTGVMYEVIADYERIIWNLFGDPTINLIDFTLPTQPKDGWIYLSTFVDQTPTTVNIIYSITFPNQTVKSYTGKDMTIWNCPTGAYIITAQHPTLGIKVSTTIVEDAGSSIIFNFNIFVPKYSAVIISVDGIGSTDPLEGIYEETWRIGDNLTVNAYHGFGWHFINFRVNGIVYTTNSITATLNAITQIRAYFEEDVPSPPELNSNITIHTLYYDGISWNTQSMNVDCYYNNLLFNTVTTNFDGTYIINVLSSGVYTFKITYLSISNQTSVDVTLGINEDVSIFITKDSPPPQQTGSFKIKSNIDCQINVTGYNTIFSVPFDLVGIPIGVYNFTAWIVTNIETNEVKTKTWTYTLEADEVKEYTFEWEIVPPPPINYIQILFAYSPYIFFMLAFLVFTSKKL